MKMKNSKYTASLVVLATLFVAIFFCYIIVTVEAPSNNFNVEWNLLRDGVGRNCYKVSIQNLNDTTQDFNLSVLFSNTTFNVENIRNVELFEWKALDKDYPVYYDTVVYFQYPLRDIDGNITNKYPSDCWNDTLNTTHYPCNMTLQNGTETKKLCDWKPAKQNMFKESNKYKSEGTLMNIPKYDSKAKYDDFNNIETINGTKYFKVCYDTPVIERKEGWGSIGNIAFLDELTQEEYHPWWNTSWNKCMNITLSNAGSTTLTNFPMYINLTYDSDMRADYNDLRFVDTYCGNDGTELDYEIENYTASIVHTWVRIPSLPSAGTIISVYYNNSDATVGENPTGVWDDNYTFVSHMDDGTTSTILDSTQYSNDGTKVGANQPILSSGRIANAQTFDGVNDYIELDGENLLEGYSTGTIEVWALDTEQDDFVGIISDRWSTNDINFTGFVTDWVPRYYFQAKVATEVDSWGSANTNGWYHLAGYWDNTNQYMLTNAVAGSSSAKPAGFSSQNSFKVKIGVYYALSDGREFKGTIDEVRFSNINRSTDWINMSYQNIVDYGSYVSYGSEETADTTFPKIFVTEPANSSTNNWLANFTINGTVTEGNPDTVWINDTRFNWNSNYASWKFQNNTALADGDYMFNISANDTTGNQNSTYWEIILDTTNPTVKFNNDSFITNNSTVNIYFTPDDNIDFAIACKMYFDDSQESSGTFTAGVTTYTVATGVADGNYTVTINCTDNANNVGENSSIWVFVDTTFPKIFVDYPVNNSAKTSVAWFNITGTVTEGNPDTLTINDTIFTTNTGNYGAWNFTNVSAIIDKDYVILLTANDSVGNINSTYLYFTLNTSAGAPSVQPSINIDIIRPSGAFMNVTQNQFFNVSFNVTCQKANCGEVNVSLDPSVNWWNTSFEKCKNITVSNAGGTTLTDFPAYVNLPYDSDMQVDFSDIRFIDTYCDNGGSILSYEVENYTATNAHTWVKIPSLPSAGTIISVYYNNTDATSKANSSAVWDSNYILVLHTNETGTGVRNDSTSNNNYATATNYDGNEDMPNGAVDGADDLADVGDHLLVANEANFDFEYTDVFSGCAWINLSSVALTSQNFLSKLSNSAPYPGWEFSAYDPTGGSDGLQMYLINSYSAGTYISVYVSNILAVNNWDYACFTYKGTGTASGIRIYFNGKEQSKSVAKDTLGLNSILNNIPVNIGIRNSAGWPYSGRIDEVRISNTNRSTDWINQSYQIVANQGTYVVFANEETYEAPSAPTGKGLINTTVGALPFYTNDSNPRNITLNQDESQIVTFWVNATGTIGDSYDFFAYVNETANMTNSNITTEWNVTIVAYVPPSDTCTPPASGDWHVDFGDYCNWTTPQSVPAGFRAYGTGICRLSSTMSFTGATHFIYGNSSTATLYIESGGRIQKQ